MESMYLNFEEIDKRIEEYEQLIKKHPNNPSLNIGLESLKTFRKNAIEEIERRETEKLQTDKECKK